MPRRKNRPKKASERSNTGTKRKTISPLETIDTRTNTHGATCTLDNRYGDTDDDRVNNTKRFHSSSPDFFTFDQYSATEYNVNMSYMQTPYAQQFVQSPPGYTGMTQIPPVPPAQQSTAIPPWANAMMEEIKVIKSAVTKIDSVEKTVNMINKKFSELEVKVTDIDKRVAEVEKSCTYISSGFETNARELKQAKTDISKLQKSCQDYETKVKSMSSEMQTLSSRLTESESRSMRNNLIFYGINEQTQENCEDQVKQFIKNKLDINADDMIFDRAHRMGNEHAKKPRPIVVRFNYYKERETVRTKAYDANDAMKRDGLGVSIQRPKTVREARKSLYHVMKQERDKGNSVKFIGDKLFINNVLYVPPQ